MELMDNIVITRLSEDNAARVCEAFSRGGLDKSRDLFDRYLREQDADSRVVLVAIHGDRPVGYLTIVWESKYPPFRQDRVPEINDFNMVPSFRRRGIGTALMDEAETLIRERSTEAGIGVGMYADYGPAQRMYVLRGYVPDGLGLTTNHTPVTAGRPVKVDDELVLWFRKSLERPM